MGTSGKIARSLTTTPRRTAEAPGWSRRGFTLVEVIAAASLLGVLFAVTIPLLAHVRSVRQEADRRALAQQEAANVMERAAALAMHKNLAEGALARLPLSPAAARLPSASLNVTVADDDGALGGQRVRVAVGWTTDVGEAAPPAELTAWFPTGEEN